MPIPSFLKVFNMGQSSSQPERAEGDIEYSQDIVHETPQPPSANGGKTKKSSKFPKPTISSPEISNSNGNVTPPDSDTSKPPKRKRESETEGKKKHKKRSKSDNMVTEEPTDDTLLESPVVSAAEIPPTPNQPTPSTPAHSSAKSARKAKKNDTLRTITSVQSATNTPSDAKKATAAKQTPSPVTPKLENIQTEDQIDAQSRSGGRPRSARGSRTREKDSLKIGFYTPEEVQKIETYKVDFCTMHSLTGTKFDEMIQHSERGGNGDFPVSTEVISKGDFWNEIYALVPDRDRRSVYRFMRRHFQGSTQKAHDWTQEQEDELVSLHAQHGPKWTYIGKLIGRSDDDVTQRWKNKLEHQGVMNRGGWSAEETKTFLDAMEDSWANMKPMLSEAVGKDFYDLDEQFVTWGNVSKAMGYRRSRQQCADKWRKIVKQVKTMRANGMPDAVFDIQAAVKNVANWNGRLHAKNSDSVVEDDDDDEEGQVHETPKSSQQTPSEDHPKLGSFLSQLADNIRKEDSDQPEASPETQKSKKSKRKNAEEAASDSHDEAQSEDDVDVEPELPKASRKSKRHRVQDNLSDPAEEPAPSPPWAKKSKAERKREKRELRVKEEQEQTEAQTEVEVEADEKPSRKESKRLRKAEKSKKRE